MGTEVKFPGGAPQASAPGAEAPAELPAGSMALVLPVSLARMIPDLMAHADPTRFFFGRNVGEIRRQVQQAEARLMEKKEAQDAK